MKNRYRSAADWLRENLIYREEQILPSVHRLLEKTPREIRAMRELARGFSGYRSSREAVFLKQAKVMERFEDDHPYAGQVLRYYPTYESLSDEELRGYFTWRTKLRRGELEKTSLSYAFLYSYELLNQIGVSDPLDGLEKLRALRAGDELFDGGLHAYLDRWMRDYLVYYDLPPVLLAEDESFRRDAALLTLREPDKHDSGELAAAARALSGYRLEKSRFYKKYPAETEAVIAAVLRGIAAHYEKSCQRTWIEDYIGSVHRAPVTLFEGAVFCPRRDEPDRNYAFSAVRRYRCRKGEWTLESCDYGRLDRHRLGDVLRTVDSAMREAWDFPYPTKPGLSTKWLLRLIDEAIREQQEKQREAEKKVLHLDLSRLGGIRRDAAYTRERLLVDEELAEETADAERGDAPAEAADKQTEIPPLFAGTQEEAAPAAASPLDALTGAERRYLACLLRGDGLSWLRGEGLLASVLDDGINEKLFDLFGDTVIQDGAVLEDYFDDLKESMKL